MYLIGGSKAISQGSCGPDTVALCFPCIYLPFLTNYISWKICLGNLLIYHNNFYLHNFAYLRIFIFFYRRTDRQTDWPTNLVIDVYGSPTNSKHKLCLAHLQLVFLFRRIVWFTSILAELGPPQLVWTFLFKLQFSITFWSLTATEMLCILELLDSMLNSLV